MAMSIEEMLVSTVRVAVREEVRTAMREALAQVKPAGEFLSIIEAAKLACVHPETVRQWVRDGLVPRHRAGREYRIRRDELEAYLSRTDTAPADDPEAAAAAILAKTRAK